MDALSNDTISILAERSESFSMAARDIYPLICVRDPYFAFQRFDIGSDTVSSALCPAHPALDELGPISAAEAGRHLAILGSCAAALANPTRARHYYLAREAYIERTTAPVLSDGAELIAHASGMLMDRRSAQAKCSLHAGDAPLWSLDVRYAVLSEALFARFYGKHATMTDNVTPLQRLNPYGSGLPLRVFETDGSRLKGTLGVIRQESCAGHFPRFPCLPVALLMNALAQAAGALLARRAGTPQLKYTVEYAEVCAQELAFAGSRIDLEARYVGAQRRGDQFRVRATSDAGNDVGELVVVLAGRGG